MLILTMAGEGKRFRRKGYHLPKYLLDFRGSLILEHVLNNFKKYILENGVKLVYRQQDIEERDLSTIVKRCGISTECVDFLALDQTTGGQAETAAKAIEYFNITGCVVIANIDTIMLDWEFKYFADIENVAGYIDYTDWDGDNWSFLVLNEFGEVSDIREKQRISANTSTGIYAFSSSEQYLYYFKRLHLDNFDTSLGEKYVSMVYKLMIDDSQKIVGRYVEQSSIILLGTPEEYLANI